MSGDGNGTSAAASRFELLVRWVRILNGTSYWHRPVRLGAFFVPGQLYGYYNDYSDKTDWNGPTDAQGIPLNKSPTGRRYYFPMTVLQKALGHWERWLSSGRNDEYHRSEFLKLAVWILERQDRRGGWPTWPDCGVQSVTPYSAMTQGQAVSLLVRARSVTSDECFLRSAARAVTLMTLAVEDGGTSRYVPEGIVLEEVPLMPPRTVLNGWINGVFGLYDFWLIDGSHRVKTQLEAALSALVSYLPRYEGGYWSYYDTAGHLASPYYHERHIAQLKACERTFGEHEQAWRQTRERLERQAASMRHRTTAVIAKAFQQLRNPPESVMK